MKKWLVQLFCEHAWEEVHHRDYCSFAQALIGMDDGTRRRETWFECRKCKKTRMDDTMVVTR
jgi:hypothetical protein